MNVKTFDNWTLLGRNVSEGPWRPAAHAACSAIAPFFGGTVFCGLTGKVELVCDAGT